MREILSELYGKENCNDILQKVNELIQKYQDKNSIFDIAKIESTYTDGSRCTFKVNGTNYFSLIPEYTTDGEHLNRLGRKKVAEQLIIFLANLN